MGRLSSSIYILLIALLMSGCYHAQITTGEEPSTEVYEETFASGWLFGLVPPDVVRAQDECTNGVARVETRLSFVNMLVGNLTFGIYTPMHIKVTCAASSAELLENNMQRLKVDNPDSEQQVYEVFQNAVNKAVESREAVFVEMR